MWRRLARIEPDDATPVMADQRDLVQAERVQAPDQTGSEGGPVVARSRDRRPSLAAQVQGYDVARDRECLNHVAKGVPVLRPPMESTTGGPSPASA